MTPTLHTSRLTLRPFTLEDAPELQKALNDPEIADFTLTIPRPLPSSFALERIGRDLERVGDPHHSWGLFARETGELVGHLALGWDLRHRKGGLGYWTARGWRGQGLMTEALLEGVRYAFGPLELYRLEANHFPRNPASGRALEKAGFQCEGLLRAFVWKGDTPEDVVQYALLKPDWASSASEEHT